MDRVKEDPCKDNKCREGRCVGKAGTKAGTNTGTKTVLLLKTVLLSGKTTETATKARA